MDEEIKTRRRLSTDEVRDAIHKNRGLLTYVAQDLGVRKSHVRAFINRKTSLMTELNEARESFLDVAEKKLFEKIEAGEHWAIVYYLSTQGKSRGYISPNSKTGNIGDTNNITVTTFNIVSAQAGEHVDLDRSVVIRQITEQPQIEHDDDDATIDLDANPEPEPQAIATMRQRVNDAPLWFRPIDDESDDR